MNNVAHCVPGRRSHSGSRSGSVASSRDSSPACKRQEGESAEIENLVASWASEVECLRRDVGELQLRKKKAAAKHALLAVRMRGEQQKSLDETLLQHRRQEQALQAAARIVQEEAWQAAGHARRARNQIQRTDEVRRLVDMDRKSLVELEAALNGARQEAVVVAERAREGRQEALAETELLRGHCVQFHSQVKELELGLSRSREELCMMDDVPRLRFATSGLSPALQRPVDNTPSGGLPLKMPPDTLQQLKDDVYEAHLECEKVEIGRNQIIAMIEAGVSELESELHDEKQAKTRVVLSGNKCCERLSWELAEETTAAKDEKSRLGVALAAIDDEIARLKGKTEREIAALTHTYNEETEQQQEKGAELKKRAAEACERWRLRASELRNEFEIESNDLEIICKERSTLGDSISELSSEQQSLEKALAKGRQEQEQVIARQRCISRDMDKERLITESSAKRAAAARAARQCLITELEQRAQSLTADCEELGDEVEQAIQENDRRESFEMMEVQRAAQRRRTFIVEEEESEESRCKELVERAREKIMLVLQDFETRTMRQHEDSCRQEARVETVAITLSKLRAEVEVEVEKASPHGGVSGANARGWKWEQCPMETKPPAPEEASCILASISSSRSATSHAAAGARSNGGARLPNWRRPLAWPDALGPLAGAAEPERGLVSMSDAQKSQTSKT